MREIGTRDREALKIEPPTNASELSPDRPLSDARADALGHAAFASHLARTIAQLAPRAGIAIGLHGDPGAGRSSMLNLVRHALREQPQSSKWTIVEWNPWLLTGNDDLERRFVHLLATATLPSSPAGDPPPDDSQVAALRARVASTFSSGDKRLVVVIDDVDRLPADRAAEVLAAAGVGRIGPQPDLPGRGGPDRCRMPNRSRRRSRSSSTCRSPSAARSSRCSSTGSTRCWPMPVPAACCIPTTGSTSAPTASIRSFARRATWCGW